MVVLVGSCGELVLTYTYMYMYIYRVTAHFVPQTSSDNKESGGQVPSSSSSGGGQRVTLLIKFDPRVLEREAMLAQSD